MSGKILHHYQVPTDESQLWQLMWINPGTLLPPPVVPRPATSKEIAAGKPQVCQLLFVLIHLKILIQYIIIIHETELLS